MERGRLAGWRGEGSDRGLTDRCRAAEHFDRGLLMVPLAGGTRLRSGSAES
jgi:hypothetical protein